VFWSAEADTSVVLLTDLPIMLPTAGNLLAELRDPAARSDLQGTHIQIAQDPNSYRMVRLSGTKPGGPLAALVPLDATGYDRTDAIIRLLRFLQGKPVPRDSRLTPQQKRRHRLMLQATDGHMEGASYRQIAEVVYGVERIRPEHWKTSALRDSTIGLVEGGLAMIDGGYRQLLRHRRRD